MNFTNTPASERRVVRGAHLRRTGAGSSTPQTGQARPRPRHACSLSAGVVAHRAVAAVAGVVVRMRHAGARSPAAWWVTVRTDEHQLLEVYVSERGCCVAVESPWHREESEGL